MIESKPLYGDNTIDISQCTWNKRKRRKTEKEIRKRSWTRTKADHDVLSWATIWVARFVIITNFQNHYEKKLYYSYTLFIVYHLFILFLFILLFIFIFLLSLYTSIILLFVKKINKFYFIHIVLLNLNKINKNKLWK